MAEQRRSFFAEADALYAKELERKSRVSFTDRDVYALYLDFDGFRDRLRADPGQLYRDFTELKKDAIRASMLVGAGRIGDGPVELHAPRKLSLPYVFSDSWFLVSEDDSADSLREVCEAAATIGGHALAKRFPFHGAIARGRMWWTPQNQVVLGPAITEAYRWAESLDCYGIALVPSCPETTAASPRLLVPQKNDPPVALRFARAPASTTYRWRHGFAAARTAVQASTTLDADERHKVLRRFDRSEALLTAMYGSGDQPL